MKQTIFYLIILFVLSSCASSDPKLSHTEFERLLAQDSIGTIHINTSSNIVKVKLKTSNSNTIQSYQLTTESATAFEDALTIYKYKLAAKHQYPNYSIIKTSGPDYIYSAIPFIFLGIFILFLVVLIDILRHRFETATDKLIWVLVVFIPFAGPIIYLILGRKQIKQ